MKIKQGYDKKRYPKLVLNKLKVMGNFTSIYTPWAPNSKKFLKNFLIYMWPMFIDVRQCASMCELWMNQNSIKSELIFNLKWIIK